MGSEPPRDQMLCCMCCGKAAVLFGPACIVHVHVYMSMCVVSLCGVCVSGSVRLWNVVQDVRTRRASLLSVVVQYIRLCCKCSRLSLRPLASYCRLYVCLSVTLCIVAKRYILQQKCLNKWIGSVPSERDFTTFNPYTDPIPSNPTPKFSNVTYYISLSWSRDHFVYVANLLRTLGGIVIDVMIN